MRKLIPLAVLAIACISTKTMAHPLRQQDSTKNIHIWTKHLMNF
ncbi:hypothetical protein [Sediminibacterium roseum]|nr:hypothetical protein [Sediminibacterium roseum]